MDATAERRPFSRLPASAAFALGKSDQLTTADAGGKECGRAGGMAVGRQQAAAQAADREATGEALLRTIGHGDGVCPGPTILDRVRSSIRAVQCNADSKTSAFGPSALSCGGCARKGKGDEDFRWLARSKQPPATVRLVAAAMFTGDNPAYAKWQSDVTCARASLRMRIAAPSRALSAARTPIPF